ncbi:MAG: hypothetical protein AVDCRST_MAG88-1747, partial [uncultured Thermomicrobiales bacterium]
GHRSPPAVAARPGRGGADASPAPSDLPPRPRWSGLLHVARQL